MIDSDESERAAVLARMALSRAEIVQILDPPPAAPGADRAADNFGSFGFPRSRTMRALMSKGGLGTVGALVGGLLIARPTLAFKLLRMLPTGAVSKVILAKAIGAFTSKHQA